MAQQNCGRNEERAGGTEHRTHNSEQRRSRHCARRTRAQEHTRGRRALIVLSSRDFASLHCIRRVSSAHSRARIAVAAQSAGHPTPNPCRSWLSWFLFTAPHPLGIPTRSPRRLNLITARKQRDRRGASRVASVELSHMWPDPTVSSY